MTNIPTSRHGVLEKAVAHHQAGQWREAEALYRQVLAEDPGHAGALHLLGTLHGQTGQPETAIEMIRRAIVIDPTVARYHSNLGKFLGDQGRFDEAVAAYRAAIGIDPAFAAAHNNLGAALNAKRQCGEAVSACTEAVRLDPRLAAAHNNLGNAFRGQGQLDEAIAAYGQALRLDPGYAEAHNNLGNVLKDTGRIAEAIASYREALRIRPDFAEAQHHLLNTVHYDPDCDAAALGEEARRWYRQHAASLAASIRPHDNDRSPERRLRIGYVSPDFRDHPVGLNLLPLFGEHSRDEVEIFCYAGVVRPDALTERFRSLADQWRDVTGSSHEQVASLVRADRIDILVDLTLHAAGNRLLAFALKPAPVQVTFAGYPGTTGVETIDYRLTDPFLDPPGADDRSSAETSVRLPETFWCINPLAEDLAVAQLPAASNGFVTFGCLNNFCKVNDAVLCQWAGVMREVKTSRLLISSPQGSHRQHAQDVLQQGGVAPDRVEFVGSRPRLEYLRIYDRIDIGLDTLPYNGHTTSLDAFWMGVPVITLVGRTVVGRAGLCQLMNLGLPDLVAHTPVHFVRIAAGLAGDLPRLAGLRSSLRERMRSSPLMDGRRFARNIEAAYRAMWRRWCAGDLPKPRS